jgi:nucleoside 2-deoxyribosyltransferase
VNSRIETHLAPPRVYLCGPITGQSPLAATGWRTEVAAALRDTAECIDPTRDSPDYDSKYDCEATQPLTVERLRHGKKTIVRNKFDVNRSDIVLACFLGCNAVSIGAVGEIFWAQAMGKPVIIVREDDNIHNHDMLNEIAGWIFPGLDAAIEQVKRLLGSRSE